MGEYFFGITDKGKRRDKNEDTFIVQELSNAEFLAACVIDGVGGYSGGDIAAAIARSVILEHLKDLSGDIIKNIRIAINAANTKIRQEKRKDDKNEQMACVLTCAITDIKNNKFYYAHVGDTRLYLLRDDSLVKLTKDHSIVGFLEESGRLSEEDAMRHPRRNEITKALGFEENILINKDFIETGESPFLPGDMILLCSDGLTDMISSATIMSVLSQNNNLDEKANKLIIDANEAGGNDNITAVLVRNDNQASPHIALKPAERKINGIKPPLHVIRDMPDESLPARNKKRRSIGIFLAWCCIGILAVLLFQKNTPVRKNYLYTKNTTPNIKNENTDSLISIINASGKKFSLPEGSTILQLSGNLLINKDSFQLIGNGATIQCSPGYKGPAIILSKAAKYITLDSLLIKNFDVALITQGNNITLKHVRFINCRIPIQYQIIFSDSVISGQIKDSVFIPSSHSK